MRTVLVTGSDTGVGKTRVAGALARLLGADGSRMQIVKPVETGRLSGAPGDADEAARIAGRLVDHYTLARFSAALAPADAAKAEGREISFEDLVRRTLALPEADWRIVEGAGGIASPLDASDRDWADFAAEVGASSVVIVVPDRLGAINQARLAHAHAARAGLNAGIWLNVTMPVEGAVAASNRRALKEAGVPVWAEQDFQAEEPREGKRLREVLAPVPSAAVTASVPPSSDYGAAGKRTPCELLDVRCADRLAERKTRGLLRTLRVTCPPRDVLNLADNDYLALAQDPAVVAATREAIAEFGTSASAAPLVTGWRAPHEVLLRSLTEWHGFPSGMLCSSGYAANSAVLGTLPERGDRVMADRLSHHSMLAGILHSGARLQRYAHLDLGHLERLLGEGKGAPLFVATESLFSMDGDHPDLARMAKLKRTHPFTWLVDEAHAIGWFGPEGSGLVREAGVADEVDIVVGTLGKALASGGAYALFRNPALRDYVVNEAGEFIYSTAIPPANAAAAGAALVRIRSLAAEQPRWRAFSREFRAALRADGWDVPEGESPIVPLRLPDPEAAVSAASALRKHGILAAAIRPPTVPAGTSRLRFSLKRTLDPADISRVAGALAQWKQSR